MNQQTLQCIYQKYQPQQYFANFFKQRQRPDGRKFHQYRKIKFTIEKNKVALSQGQNIIMSQYHKKYQAVPYAGYSQNIQKLKLKIKFAGTIVGSGSSHNINRRQKYLEQLIKNQFSSNQVFTFGNYIQNQKNKQSYLQTGQINVKIIGQDGCLQEALLLNLAMLCWVVQLPEPTSQSSGKQRSFLNVQEFLYPIKYVQVYNEILIDPTIKQEQNSSQEIIFIHNLLSKSFKPLIIHKTHQRKNINNSSFSETSIILKAYQKMSRQHLQKIGLDLFLIRKKLALGQQQIVNVQIQDSV